MLLRALPLAALALSAGLCGGEDPVAVLEARKQEVLATTVEKKEFWAQVERKGALAKRRQQLEEEEASLGRQLAELEARRAALAPGLAPAREVNQRAEEVKGEVLRREEELAERIRELEETLARWKSAAAEAGEGAG